MTDPFYIDTETFSRTSLRSAGTYRYAADAEIMLITWADGDRPVQCWDYHDDRPVPDFSGRPVVYAHKAMFDRNVLRLGNLRIDLPLERWRCTMVQAMQHALPGGLDELGRVLGLPQDMQKIGEGKKLIQLFCKPRPGNCKLRRATRETHPDKWQQFKEYAMQDVVAMREIHKRLPAWNWQADDINMWHLDQRINDRGFAVDLELVNAGARAAIDEKEYLGERFAVLTGGLQPSQRAKVQAFINDRYKLNLNSTAREFMEPISKDPKQPDELREIASIVLLSNKTSTAKYASLSAAVSADGRFRGGLQFAGASRTRRWAGRVFQPQNLPSRGLPPEAMIDAYIHALKAGCYRDMFDDLMLYGSAALRGAVVANKVNYPGLKAGVSRGN